MSRRHTIAWACFMIFFLTVIALEMLHAGPFRYLDERPTPKPIPHVICVTP